MAPIRPHEGHESHTLQPAATITDEFPLTYTFLNEMSPPIEFEAVEYSAVVSTANNDTIPELHVSSPQRTSHGKRRDASYIPRPPNAFILFRSSFIRDQKVTNKVEGNHSNLSKIIGMYWKTLPKAQRDEWEDKAAQALLEHRRRYPDWRFRPSSNATVNSNTKPKPKEVARRSRAKKVPPDRGGDAPDGEGGDVDKVENGNVTRGRRRGRGRGRGVTTSWSGAKEATRLSKIAGLLVEGREGVALERAVEEWEAGGSGTEKEARIVSDRAPSTSVSAKSSLDRQTTPMPTPTTPSGPSPLWLASPVPAPPVTPRVSRASPSWPSSPVTTHATTPSPFNLWPLSPNASASAPPWPSTWITSHIITPSSIATLESASSHVRRSRSRSPSCNSHPSLSSTKRSLSAPAPHRRSQNGIRSNAGFWWSSQHHDDGISKGPVTEGSDAEIEQQGSFDVVQHEMDEPMREGSFDVSPEEPQEYEYTNGNGNESVNSDADGWGWGWSEETKAAYGEYNLASNTTPQPQLHPPAQWSSTSYDNYCGSNSTAGDSIHPLPPTPISSFSLLRSTFSSLAGWDGSASASLPPPTPSVPCIESESYSSCPVASAHASLDLISQHGGIGVVGPWDTGNSWGGLQGLGVQGG